MNAPTLAALMLVAVAAWSGYTVVNYAERHIWASNDAWVLKVCWGAYVLSWLPIVLLPFEVMNADLTRCSINWTFWSWFRHLGWIVLYWTITVMAYVVNDFARCYVYSGGFTFRRKAWLSWKYIRDFYWPLAAAGLVLTVAILWWEGEVLHFGAWATFLTVVMYTANLWGVLMFIFLMSHALVELPKQLWHLSRADQRLKRAYNRVGESARKLLSAQESWGAELAKWERMKEAIASESYGAVPSDEPSAVRGESAAGAVTTATQVVPGEGGTSGGPAVQYKSELGHFVREISISPARAGAPLAGAVPGLQTLVDVALVGETGRSTRAVTRGGTASDRRTGGAINVDWSNKDKAQAALEGLHETFRAEAFLWRQANQVFATALDTAIEQHAMATLAGGGRHEKYKAVAAAPAFAEPSAAARPLKSARGRWGDALAKVQFVKSVAPEVEKWKGRLCTPPVRRMVDAASIHSVRGASLCFLVAFTCFGATLLLSEATLPLYFFPGLPADDSDAATAASLPHPIDTPIGAIHRHWFSSGPVSLTFLGAVLLLCCSWSLEGWSHSMAESIFWFRGFHRGATDAGSLAFHSACFCRLSVMLAYNVNLLVIPPEQAGLSTEQTHFYCLFAKKSRLLLTPSGDKDFYLYVAYQFDVLARLYQWGVEHRGWQNVNVFKFGSDSIGICEAGGRRIVERVFDAQQKAYAATSKIQSAARRRSSAAAAAADVAAAAAAAVTEGGAGADDGLHTHDAGMAATGPTTMV